MSNEEQRQAKADAKAAKAKAKAMRPWYKKKRWIGSIAIVVLIGIAAAGGGGSSNTDTDDVTPVAATDSGPKSDFSTNTENPPAADVSIDTCSEGTFGPEVKVKVVNNSSKTSDYIISLGAEDAAGNKVGDGIATVDNVKPGQTAIIDGLLTGEGIQRCVIEEVERFAS